MNEYYLGLYRKGSPFHKDFLITGLSILQREMPDFFPARFEYAPGKSHEIRQPGDFRYEWIPDGFWVEQGLSVRIPIDGNNGTELVVLDDRESTAIPSNFRLVWKTVTDIPAAERLAAIFCALATALEPTSGHITHTDVAQHDEIYERSFLIDDTQHIDTFYWFTWLSPANTQNLNLSGLSAHLPGIHLYPCAGGTLVQLMDTALEENNPEHLALRTAAEDISGLAAFFATL